MDVRYDLIKIIRNEHWIKEESWDLWELYYGNHSLLIHCHYKWEFLDNNAEALIRKHFNDLKILTERTQAAQRINEDGTKTDIIN